MSADNGIYILKTLAPKDAEPDPGSAFEYRVAHAQAIDNLYYDVVSGEHQKDFIPEMAFQYFGSTTVHREMLVAGAVAHKLAELYSVLEYGIQVLDHSNQVFQKFTDEQIEAYNEETDMLIQAQQAERQARLDEQREKATIQIPAGTEIEVGRCPSAVFTTPDGKKLRGWASLGKITLAEDTEFLPHDWNKDEF